MDYQTIIIILSACLAVSEALALIPGLKTNGILSAIIKILRMILPGKNNG